MSDQPAVTSAPRAVSAPDGDIGTLNFIVTQDDAVIRVGAWCNKPGQALTGRVVTKDASGNLLNVSLPLTFTSDPVAHYGALFLGTPSFDPYFPLGGGAQAAFHVDAVSGGTWTISEVAQ